MRKYLLNKIVTVLFVSGIVFFSGDYSVFAHDDCNQNCNKKQICDMPITESLVPESKENLLELKETIQEHLTRENKDKLDEQAVESLRALLNDINQKLENIIDEENK